MNSLSNYTKADSSIDQLNDSYQDSDIIPHNYTMPEPESSVIIVGTDLRRNPWYILIYLFWSKFLLVEIVPYFLMVVMNVLIWRKIQEFARVRSTTLGMNAGTIGIKISSNNFYVYTGVSIIFIGIDIHIYDRSFECDHTCFHKQYNLHYDPYITTKYPTQFYLFQ
jgi:hypothetical protein